MTHTATPWEILEDIDSTSIMKDGFFVALCAGYVHGQRDTDKANAKFIVRACNAHDDLVKALRSLITASENIDGEHVIGLSNLNDQTSLAYLALAKAGAE